MSAPAGSRATPASEGLRQTIEWFLQPANLARYNPNEYDQ